jgi:hypothetical protein
MQKSGIIASAAVLTGLYLVSCSGKNDASDYSKSENWLSLPTSNDREVDVFYLYPTSYNKSAATDPDVCGIDNSTMRTYAQLAFQRQARAFEVAGNIYAPYYRQADASTCLSLSLEEQDELLRGLTKSDVFAAFKYFIKNYNNGRPFILAGHSQGSNMLLYLLSEYMEENPDVYERMVAAYVIGYSITDDYLSQNPHLKFAEGADDTGVIISYNTEAPTIAGNNPVLLPGAIAINPLNWKRDETPAAAGENLGSILLNSDGSVVLDEQGCYKIAKNFADARVDLDRGSLICSTVDVDKWAPGNPVFPRGVFHSFDYPFYFYNIQVNAAERANNFLAGY